MAADESHAAWHDKREFAVRLHAGGSARDLAAGLPDLLAAVDYAVEWLEREDPSRSQDLRLTVVETRDGVATEVWSYPPSSQPSSGRELVERLGFNPATWQPHTDDRAPLRPRRPPASPSPPTPLPPLLSMPAPESALDDAGESQAAPRRSLRDRVRDIAQLCWNDRASRSCTVVAGISIWLAVTLTSLIFVVPLLASASGLWFLHHRRPTPAADPDDWL